MRLAIHPEIRRNPHLLDASALGLSVGMLSGLFYSMGTFMPVWEIEFGWSRAEITLLLTFATLAMCLRGTLAGKLSSLLVPSTRPQASLAGTRICARSSTRSSFTPGGPLRALVCGISGAIRQA